MPPVLDFKAPAAAPPDAGAPTRADGLLDEKARALAAVAAALALRHPNLGEALAAAKLRGVSNAEIGEVTAVVEAWRPADGAPAPGSAGEDPRPGACC